MFKYTEKKLAKDVGKVARSIDPTLEYVYLPDSQEVQLTPRDNGSCGTITVFLGNIFLKVLKMPKKERAATIEAFLREVLAPKELSSSELMESLALRVRTGFEIDFRNRNIELSGYEAPLPISNITTLLALQ